MSGLFLAALESGALIDLVLGFMLLELVLLGVLARGWGLRGTRSPMGVVDIVGHLSAGAFLLLALRSALRSGANETTAVFLALSLPAHLFDLVRRWRKGVSRQVK